MTFYPPRTYCSTKKGVFIFEVGGGKKMDRCMWSVVPGTHLPAEPTIDHNLGVYLALASVETQD